MPTNKTPSEDQRTKRDDDQTSTKQAGSGANDKTSKSGSAGDRTGSDSNRGSSSGERSSRGESQR